MTRVVITAPTPPIIRTKKNRLSKVANQEVMLVLCLVAASLLVCDTCKASSGPQNNTVILDNGDIRWDENDTLPDTVQRVWMSRDAYLFACDSAWEMQERLMKTGLDPAQANQDYLDLTACELMRAVRIAEGKDVDTPMYRKHTTEAPTIQKATLEPIHGSDPYATAPPWRRVFFKVPLPPQAAKWVVHEEPPTPVPGMAYNEPATGPMTYMVEITKYGIGENETVPWYFQTVSYNELSTRTMPYKKYNESEDDLFEYFLSVYET